MIWFALHLALLGMAMIGGPDRGHRRVRQWTREIIAAYAMRAILLPIAFAQWLIIPGDLPVYVHWLGVPIYIAGSWFYFEAIRVNPYAVPELIRPPVIIRDGIYHYLRHPLYMGEMMFAFGACLIWGQWWTVLPLSAYCGLLLNRMRLENRLLYRVQWPNEIEVRN